MSFLRNLKIGTRLGLGFGWVVFVTVMVSLYSLHNAGTLNTMLTGMHDNNLVPIADIANANMQAIYHNRSVFDYAMEPDKAKRAEIAGAMKKYDTNMIALLEKYRKTLLTDKEKELLRKFDDAWPPYMEVAGEVVGLANAGNLPAATALLEEEASARFQVVDDLLTDLLNVNKELADKTYTESGQMVANIAKYTIGLLILCALVNVLIAIRTSLGITRPIRELSGVIEGLAQGDLTRVPQVRTTDEIGQMQASLKTAIEKLAELMGTIRESSANVSMGSRQIAAGNSDLSSRTQEQASSLEETASSMDELTSTVKQNAENAKQANQLAAGASEVALKGGEVVGRVVSTMSGISEASKKIADIIGTIDGIAFQTNILALNAAVEAARAGEQGRGFAVVATEVRNLAQRSSAAAKEIKALISDSVDRVDAGSKLVDQAGRTMEDVVAAVKRVTDIMGEISAASSEQSAGIDQVNQAVVQMDTVTQQNAALVEEAAAAAEGLEEQAKMLVKAVSVFKIADREQQSLASPAPARSNRGPATRVDAGPRPKAAKKVAGSDVNSDEEWAEF